MKIYYKKLIGKYGPCWTERNTKPTHIVLHHTASGWDGKEPTGGCNSVWNYWWGLKPGSRVSSHDIVGKNGYIMRCVSPLDTAWHAGSSEWNEKSIGIEIVNRGDNKDPFPNVQMRAVAWLVYRYMKRFNIPRSNITDHKAVCKGKIDMRDNFDWNKLWKHVKNIEYVEELRRSKSATKTVVVTPKSPSIIERLRARLAVKKKLR